MKLEIWIGLVGSTWGPPLWFYQNEAAHVEGEFGGFEIIFVREKNVNILQKDIFTPPCIIHKESSMISVSNYLHSLPL